MSFGIVIAILAQGAPAADVVLIAIPVEPVWIADGRTVYQMDIWADNTGDGNAAVSGVQWKICQSHVLLVASSLPQDNDFFEGWAMFFEDLVYCDEGDRLVLDASAGPENTRGKVVTYWFVVFPGAELGPTLFSLGPWKVEQPTEFRSEPFTIIAPPCPGDVTGDLVVDFADLTSVLSNWLTDYWPVSGPGDANTDGVVNFADLTSVLSNWLAACP